MRQRELLMIAVTIFCTIVAWVLVEVLTISKNTLPPPDPNKVTQVKVDTSIFEILKQKVP